MRQRGFTLLELMISILLFAMISAAAYKLFESVSKAQSVTDGILDKLDAIQRAEVIIEKDFFQMVDRSIRDEKGERQKAFMAPSQDNLLVEFTRSGWRNPLNSLRSNLQRVAYNVENGELIRYYWVMLDRPPDAMPFRQKVLSKVVSMNMRFLDDKRKWRSQWPPKDKKNVQEESKVPANKDYRANDKTQENNKTMKMPAAVEISIVHEEFGRMITVVPLITSKSNQRAGNHNPGDDFSQSEAERRLNFNPELEDGL